MAVNDQKQPHFVLFPYLAQGHMIPMVDIARLLARRGVEVTLLFTPVNFRRIKPVIDRAVASGLSIRVKILQFPSVEAGLPEGCENMDMLPSFQDLPKFQNCMVMLKDQVEDLLKELEPSCLISDMSYPWTTNLARDLDIPRIVFHGTGCFPMVVWENLILEASQAVGVVPESDTDYFVVPGLPDRIEITKAQFMGTTNQLPSEWAEKFREEILEAETKAFGTVLNNFEELEPEYIKLYMKEKNPRVWPIGPVSLCNGDELDKVERGNKADIDKHQCLEWLDLQRPGSVVYVCLGSLSRIHLGQLIEIGLGLEASGRPFVWVVRNASDEFKAWLVEENFEERVRTRLGGRGILIHGWAPQVLILSHPSVGSFLTHCGWNSTLEGITTGVPMVTWPFFGDQFLNEKFIVSVIKTGVKVGVELPVVFGMEDEVGIQVKREDIRIAIDEAIDGGDEGEERRDRARKLGNMAKTALVDEKGSSYINMARLIQDVQQYKM